jgi:hypothetical protein
MILQAKINITNPPTPGAVKHSAIPNVPSSLSPTQKVTYNLPRVIEDRKHPLVKLLSLEQVCPHFINNPSNTLIVLSSL